MAEHPQTAEKPVGTREWYDFVGQLADAVPFMHLGGKDATEKLLEMCRVSDAERVLDVGCGGGDTACLVAQKYAIRVDGVDLSEVMVESANSKARKVGCAELVVFQVGSIYELPYENETFDVVYLESVLTPLPGEKSLAMVEMLRVLRPGGRLGVNESIVDSSAPEEWVTLMAEHPAFYGYFTAQKLYDLFDAAGLQTIEMVEHPYEETPQVLKGMGFKGVLSFMFRAYPKIIWKLLRDSRFREASRIDNELTKHGKKYLGYALIVGQKPGS